MNETMVHNIPNASRVGDVLVITVQILVNNYWQKIFGYETRSEIYADGLAIFTGDKRENN